MDIFDTDFHCHVLPGIDDGAHDLDESVALINMQLAQGVRHIVATPHYRMHEMSVDRFINRRGNAFNKLVNSKAFEKMPDIMLAAEVALEHNLCELPDIKRLASLPRRSGPISRWMLISMSGSIFPCSSN